MQFNDKTNPQVVMAAYCVPKRLHLILARLYNFQRRGRRAPGHAV